MKKDGFYDDILQRDVKAKKSTNKKSLKERLKLAV